MLVAQLHVQEHRVDSKRMCNNEQLRKRSVFIGPPVGDGLPAPLTRKCVGG